MEITFLWSWLSFWIGFASVFVLAIVLTILAALVQASKKKKNDSLTGLEEWASRLKQASPPLVRLNGGYVIGPTCFNCLVFFTTRYVFLCPEDSD